MALLFKEMKIGLLNGASLGLMTFVILGFIFTFQKYVWMSAFLISGCVGISLVVAMVISSLVGTIIPMFSTRFTLTLRLPRARLSLRLMTL